MALLERARILKGRESDRAVLPISAPGRRVIPREEAEAHATAERIVRTAEANAARLLADAETRAQRLVEVAREQGEQDAGARRAADALAREKWVRERDAQHLNRTVELAELLAERLIGERLHLDPSLVVSLAERSLAEVSAAKTVRIECSPSDVSLLRDRLASGGLPPSLVEIAVRAELSPGSLHVHTEIGSVDARLSTQLERLAHALREALRKGP